MTHRPIIFTRHLKDFPILCDEKHQVRIKPYIHNGSVTFWQKGHLVGDLLIRVVARIDTEFGDVHFWYAINIFLRKVYYRAQPSFYVDISQRLKESQNAIRVNVMNFHE